MDCWVENENCHKHCKISIVFLLLPIIRIKWILDIKFILFHVFSYENVLIILTK